MKARTALTLHTFYNKLILSLPFRFVKHFFSILRLRISQRRLLFLTGQAQSLILRNFWRIGWADWIFGVCRNGEEEPM
ncbi:MAG: hypothetical protein A2Z25_11215 [Planctomycetes bacterium RBG_16_55_9]|nr:MAG: hypothetical protein A2Z25_11215 [Planctomycetes bacterium RBG_16_55_9]